MDSESGDENIKNRDNVYEEMEDEIPVICLDDLKKARMEKKYKEKEKHEKATEILSFDNDDHEEDTGEFKIKKSSNSKKIAKQLKKELQKEKEEKERVEKQKKEADQAPAQSRNYSAEAQNEMNGTLTLNSPKPDQNEEQGGRDKFSKTEPMLDLVESGAIPDAATIHAIRKKRKLARENQLQDYIPLNKDELFENRREEDHDASDDDMEEEDTRIAMVVNKKDAQLRHMQQAVLQAREEDIFGSDHDWEEQQIRKGVHINKSNTSHANCQDSKRQPDYSNQVADMEVEELTSPHINTSHRISNTKLPPVAMESIITRLKNTLQETNGVHCAHVHERDDLASRLDAIRIDIHDRRDGSSAKLHLERQYTFFQEMRRYVQDLVECFNHKVPVIEHWEKSMFKQYQKYAEQFVKRRQQDIKDEAADARKVNKSGAVEPPPDPMKWSRTAERGARRARRKHRRDALLIKDHEDGMSTDDELISSEITSFNSKKERITTECQRLFDDVVEDFHQLHPIMEHFERWKTEHPESYQEAYIGLCLPKLLSPLIRLKLITWNPLEKDCQDFEESSWFETLIFYGHNEGSATARHDADLKLMPSIIEKVLLPKLTAFVENIWDPLSTQQTVRLVNLVKRLLADYPPLVADSKPTKMLIKALMDRMRKTLDDDVFLPLYPKQVMDNNKTAASFFRRQFWQCVKLLHNALKWYGILADRPLQELAFDGLLNRYIVLALQNSPVDHNSIYASQVIISSFPTEWYNSLEAAEGEPTPSLQSLVRYFVFAATTLNNTAVGKGELKKTECRDQIKQIAKLLVQIHATNSALQLAEKYSFKLQQLWWYELYSH